MAKDVTSKSTKLEVASALLEIRGLIKRLNTTVYEDITDDYVRTEGPEWIDVVFSATGDAQKLIDVAYKVAIEEVRRSE